MTKDAAIKRVLQVARAELGYQEKNSSSGLDDPKANAGGGNYTKYARDLDKIPNFYNGPKQGAPWCDVFYDWVLVHAFGAILAKQLLCQPDNSCGAGCAYSAMYFRHAGRFRDSQPEPGDQIFFTYQVGEVSHTGVVESVGSSTVTTIEGNTSDCVKRKTYNLSDSAIYGYGRPDWSILSCVSEPNTGNDQPKDSTPASPAPEDDDFVTIYLPVLRNGDVGSVVANMQTLLISRGYYCGGRIFSGRERADGEFGPATEAAVRDVQLAEGLQQTGVVRGSEWLHLINK